MKTIAVIIGITIISYFPFEFSSAQKIYLSPSGNDNNPGTFERPLASLSKAHERARELRKVNSGDQPVEVIALEGEYLMREPLVLTDEDAGTPISPLIFRGEEGKKAIFTGGVKILGFERVNSKLWKAYIPEVARFGWYFEQFYINGRRAVRARTPDAGFYFVKNVTETVVEKGTGRSPEMAVQKIFLDSTDSRLFISFSDQDYKDAVITFYHKWDNTRKHIYDFDSENSAIYTVGTGMKSWNPLDSKTRYFVENYRGAFDAQGEWYLERSGNLWYIPFEDENIWSSSFCVPVIDEFIVIKGDGIRNKPVSNIMFENLVFRISGYAVPEKGNEPAQAASPVGAVVTLDFVKDVSFRNCEISHTGTYAFWFRRACTDCSVSGCYLHDLGAGGVKIGETIIRNNIREITNNITIDNNIIRDGGHLFPCAVGIIIFNASDNKLTHNEIADLRYSGISVGWVWGYTPSPSKRNIIAYNHIHHLGWGELCDMGGVYTLGASEGTVVANNVIHHIYSFDYGGWGLYTDEGSFGITMENNLVYACKSSGFHQHYGKENIIRNNILALNLRAQLQATRIEEHRSISFTGNIIYFDRGTLLSSNWNKFNLFSDYNCYWNPKSPDIMFADKSFSEWKNSGKDLNSLIADPMFRDPAAYDFRFRNNSIIKKINFTPFDISQAGVYGSDKWKELAAFDKNLELKFNDIINQMEKKANK
ncbi:MAG: right-handed parallel beta-helix repeat-containing protein [Bacteroidales bacterium]|nr:right-handed parallel beta-helix repeat-containing protein [Bacteroidales bacterium]